MAPVMLAAYIVLSCARLKVVTCLDLKATDVQFAQNVLVLRCIPLAQFHLQVCTRLVSELYTKPCHMVLFQMKIHPKVQISRISAQNQRKYILRYEYLIYLCKTNIIIFAIEEAPFHLPSNIVTRVSNLVISFIPQVMLVVYISCRMNNIRK